MFGVSQQMLLWRRTEYGLPTGQRFTDISDNNLDIAVRAILQVGPMYNIHIDMDSYVYTLNAMQIM